MYRSLIKVSFCIGVYNEEDNIVRSLKKIENGLKKIFGKNNYEIIVVENGSNDRTKELLKKNKSKLIKKIYLNNKGLGLAFRTAIQNARYEYIVLNAIDLPFGFSDLKQVIKNWDEYDIYYGSKAHHKSIIYRHWKRRLVSFIFKNLIKLFFKSKIGDSQGTVFLKKSSTNKILKYCDANNAFFTSQLAIYGNKFGLKIKEIPVIMNSSQLKRNSKFNIIKDGKSMFYSIVKEYTKYRNVKV